MCLSLVCNYPQLHSSVIINELAPVMLHILREEHMENATKLGYESHFPMLKKALSPNFWYNLHHILHNLLSLTVAHADGEPL